VAAAIRLKAKVVTLSCVDPLTAEGLLGEVKKIRGQLPAEVCLLLGGPMAVSKGMALTVGGVEVLGTFEELRANLRKLGSSG
jgi:hypothetical protein